jgi:hypothetical protein
MLPGPVCRGLLVDAADHEPHDAAEGRIEQRLTDRQFAPHKGLVVVRRRGADGRMLGSARLHDHPAAERATAAAAPDLRDELAGPLGGTEVGEVQAGVGVHDAHEHHRREVESLGDHLRADEDVDLPVAEGVERAFVAAPRPHRVGVHAGHAGAWKGGPDLILEPLRAGAPRHEVRGRAGGTR